MYRTIYPTLVPISNERFFEKFNYKGRQLHENIRTLQKNLMCQDADMRYSDKNPTTQAEIDEKTVELEKLRFREREINVRMAEISDKLGDNETRENELGPLSHLSHVITHRSNSMN
jgi:hypothetical protein